MIIVLIGVYTLLFSVMGKNTAILEIVLYETTENGGYKTNSQQLYGYFSPAGTLVGAEGRIMQLHPLGLCNTNDYDELYQFGWVGVVKLEKPELEPDPCLSIFDKAGRALQRGATAVIFDISDNLEVAQTLQKSSLTHSRPVILVRGLDADRLMKIVNTQDKARIRIIYSSQDATQDNVEISHKEYFDMGIFVAVFIIFCLICVFVILKLKYRHRDRQLSESSLAKRAIAKMETRKYKLAPGKQQQIHTPNSDSSCYSSTGCDNCAICLEGYQDGQVLRVLPCSHEFHRKCVDTWLISEGRCPLCNFKITAQKVSTAVETGNNTANSNPTQSSPSGNLPSSVQHSQQQRGENSHYSSYNHQRGEYPSHQSHPSHVSHHHTSHHHRQYVKCPSCEGTAGSTSAYHYIDNSGCSSLSDYHYHTSETSQARSRALLSRPVSAYIKKSLPSPYSLSPYSCQGKYGCSGSSYHRSSNMHSNYYRNSVPSSKRDRVDKNQDFVNVPRSSSIIAVRGSSSSDPNPSDSSIECDCLKQQDPAQIDSNKSTYGSSDTKDISDTSSNDSDVYRGKDKSSSEDQTTSKLPPTKVRPSCLVKRTSGPVHVSRERTREIESDEDKSSPSSCESENDDNMDDAQENICSVCYNTGYSSVHRSIIKPRETPNYCVPSQALVKSSSRNPSSHNPTSHNTSSQTKGLYSYKKQPRTVISLHKSHTFSTSKEIKYSTSGIKMGKSYLPLNQQCISHSTSKSYCEDQTVSCQSSVPSHSRSSNKRYSLATDYHSNHMTVSNRHVTSMYSASRVSTQCSGHDNEFQGIIRPTPIRRKVCEVCQQAQSVPVSVPRRSMVLFTEPQGGFITIPLSEQDSYNPVSGV